MIVPSIDVADGQAVQLQQGDALVIEAGDPHAQLDRYGVIGVVAVIDLDAARGTRSNAGLIEELVRRGRCRVGGGIRTYEDAVRWLDAGAEQIIIGTAATPEFCRRLPAERIIAAVDARHGRVAVEGWRQDTSDSVLGRATRLASCVGGFLFTQIEHEGMLAGFDLSAVQQLIDAVGAECNVTAAGGISTARDIAALDAIGADAQVGMALYNGQLHPADGFAAPLRSGPDGLFPTVVCDEDGRSLGLVWSSPESLRRAVDERRGIYWSRSRQEIWVKGATSGATQELVRIDADCDRDALRFTVRQQGGFCHTGTRSCWGTDFDLNALVRTIEERGSSSAPGSGTKKLLDDPELLAAKLAEEAAELAAAADRDDVVHETADLLYFALVAMVRNGATLEDVTRELARRHGRVTRRPMSAKES